MSEVLLWFNMCICEYESLLHDYPNDLEQYIRVIKARMQVLVFFIHATLMQNIRISSCDMSVSFAAGAMNPYFIRL
jgi:hypothetical protein